MKKSGKRDSCHFICQNGRDRDLGRISDKTPAMRTGAWCGEDSGGGLGISALLNRSETGDFLETFAGIQSTVQQAIEEQERITETTTELKKTLMHKLFTEVPMAINQDMRAIIPGIKLRSDFLPYVLETLRDSSFKKVGRSGHGTCTLKSHEISSFKIPLPDMETQEKIASAIQNLERRKDLHEEKRNQLQDLFPTLLHDINFETLPLDLLLHGSLRKFCGHTRVFRFQCAQTDLLW